MVKVSDSISIRKVANEIIIFDRKLSKIYSFNRAASFIWELLVENVDPDEITEKIIDQFDISKETAEKDKSEFINELKDNKLLQFFS